MLSEAVATDLARDVDPRAVAAASSLFGPRSALEARLLDKAAASYPDLRFEHCSHEQLGAIVKRDGIDLATAVLFDRIRRVPGNTGLVRALEAATFDGMTNFARGRLLIVPALFYRERPEIGGDGAVVAQAATAAGLDVEVLPVGSGSTARENAMQLRDLLPRRIASPTVVVSLSKGCADLRLAFERMPVPQGLRAWVLVSGLFRPTPAIDRLQSRWWSRIGLAMLLKRQGGSAELPREFATGTGSALERPAAAPPGLPVINLIGCPLSVHLGTPFGRLRHRQMASLGPNDGLTLLRDALLEPGGVYPVWGADHYFRLPAIPTLLTRLLGHLVSIGCFDPSPVLVGRRGAGRGAPASDGDAGSGPPPPRSGFGEVSPKAASTSVRAKADGAKPPGL